MRKFRSIGIVLSAFVLSGLVGGVAAASEGGSPHVVLESQMVQTGFDPAVAVAHGYEVRTAPDGHQYSVRPGDLNALGFSEVEGPCGSSYIGFDGIGQAAAVLRTGYEVNGTVIAGAWGTTLVDGGGTSEQNFDIVTNQSYWDGYRTINNLTYGSAFAQVDTPYSTVLLSDGRTCTSGGPSTTTVIY